MAISDTLVWYESVVRQVEAVNEAPTLTFLSMRESVGMHIGQNILQSLYRPVLRHSHQIISFNIPHALHSFAVQT